MNIIAVDWAKHTAKRRAYHADLSTRRVRRVDTGGSLAQLVSLAARFEPPVLIGIDAAIGLPARTWQGLVANAAAHPSDFVDFLCSDHLPARFFDEATTPNDWAPSRPFFAVPPGKGSLRAFIDTSSDGLCRQVDRRLKANPIFATSGIPGTVGSGTRTLWQELIALNGRTPFSVWPFNGPLNTLLRSDAPVVAEIYPKACYGIALEDTLPAGLCTIAKTKPEARRAAIALLQESAWVARHSVALSDLDAARANEDDFDALMSAAALLRLLLEKAPLESPATVDHVAEGGVLGAASLDTNRKCVLKVHPNTPKPAAPAAKTAKAAKKAFPCPIPACDQVFHGSLGGWDAHVASKKKHPNWHPEITGPEERKKRFKEAFPDWFKKS